MPELFEKKTFSWPVRHMQDCVFSDMVFRRCSLDGGIVCDDASRRAVIRHIELDRCEQSGGAITKGVIFEDIVLKGTSRLRNAMFYAPALKHVKISGRIDKLWLQDFWKGEPEHPLNAEFKKANADYYKHVDWALDLREAEFSGECDIRGIPWQLIKRDPETQVVVTRQKAEAMSYELEQLNLDLTTYWGTAIRSMLKRGDDGAVLVASKRSKKFRDYLKGLHLLRQAGIAEPD